MARGYGKLALWVAFGRVAYGDFGNIEPKNLCFTVLLAQSLGKKIGVVAFTATNIEQRLLAVR
ncbi:Uncharacterised protein [Vibrio cholerae]|nr:Uncharacterised protein [Vibrio cholerae]CSC52928.1 Uncharacterised protein [Vibrio cholerae]CSI55983.1 Uncharacterised protein [Vibrio cholerae]